MTGDPVKSVPLPSGPASLCFDKDEFMKPDFNVDKFVLECRRRVQLEDFRDDLSVYLKILRNAMIELINKDYADFVNLSSNLVGMDKAIGSLTKPLDQLKNEVLVVRNTMEEAISAVENKLRQRQQIKQGKACLQRLLNINKSVEKIERLLGIQSGSNHEAVQHCGSLNGQLIERVATEFNKLQFYVSKCRGLPLIENIKPRIGVITTSLQYSLEGSFLEGLDSGNTDMLRQCLRTYALIDKIRDAENLYRQHIVRPYMEVIITEQFIKSNHNGLKGMLDKILEFIPTHCKLLTEVTSRVSSGTGEAIRGYDFVVNSVWPEVVSSIEAKTSSIFAPGNPDIFQAIEDIPDTVHDQRGSRLAVGDVSGGMGEGRTTPTTGQGRTTPTSGQGRATPTTPQSPPITIAQLPEFLQKTIIPMVKGLPEDAIKSLQECLDNSCEAIRSSLPQFYDYVVSDVTNQCAVHLKQANDIPRLYRRTNRDVPSKPSVYYTVTSEVLTSVKKMEDSLKRLKKVRGTDKGSGSLGMSDDDKIRQQFILDITNLGDQN
ncbi:COG2-like protein [Mya arenaria]|uniref:Conserved oligomeric Golgi complex subunit 2 n=1 Tax=Mya arenaria TaxID=6604 RepID=A0ABY7FCP4_MYAAR|nr:COG2-like protein [Mya arenaria]